MREYSNKRYAKMKTRKKLPSTRSPKKKKKTLGTNSFIRFVQSLLRAFAADLFRVARFSFYFTQNLPPIRPRSGGHATSHGRPVLRRDDFCLWCLRIVYGAIRANSGANKRRIPPPTTKTPSPPTTPPGALKCGGFGGRRLRCVYDQ